MRSARACLSRMRSTASSPKMLGRIDTRTSISPPRIVTLKRPSCGTRVSAMSSSDITLMREMICSACSRPESSATCDSTPSMRYLMASSLARDSMWMSLAPAFIAS